MPDFFNAKALAASESRCAALERELAMSMRDAIICKRAIRTMDDAIFSISQSGSYEQMQPYIARLVLEMELRRKSESDRIASVIYEELNNAPAIS